MNHKNPPTDPKQQLANYLRALAKDVENDRYFYVHCVALPNAELANEGADQYRAVSAFTKTPPLRETIAAVGAVDLAAEGAKRRLQLRLQTDGRQYDSRISH